MLELQIISKGDLLNIIVEKFPTHQNIYRGNFVIMLAFQVEKKLADMKGI